MSATITVNSFTPEEVVIGTQTWMKKNYDFATPGTFSYPGYDFTNVTEYGINMIWEEAMAINIPGWHLPTLTEFETLFTYLGGASVAGGHMKEAGTTHWEDPNTGGDNSSGFTAVGSGNMGANFKHSTYFWTSSIQYEGWVYYVRMLHDSTVVGEYTQSVAAGDRMAVRLIKN